MTKMIKQLAHVCIQTNDLAESQRFYFEILDMDKVFEFVKDDELYGFYAGSGNTTFIEVFKHDGEINAPQPAILHVCLEVEDIDAFISSVKGNGWPVEDKKMGADNTWQTWLKDPDGIDIEVQQYTDESSQLNGRKVIVDW